MKRRVISTFVFLCLLIFSVSLITAQTGKALTNADILEMIGANLSESTIVLAIQQSASAYDTSPQALIQLKKAGATQKILDAMLQTKQPTPTAAAAATTTTKVQTSTGPQMGPFGSPTSGTVENIATLGEVLLVDAQSKIMMKRASTELGTDSGKMMIPYAGLFMKAKSNARLNGNHAQLRTVNNKPEFEITLQADENASDVVAVVILKPKSDRREIQIGRGGVASSSSGFRKEDIVPVTFEEIQTYTGTGMKQIKYRVKVVTPIPSGEYALSVNRIIYYDFGVDSSK